MDHVRGEETRNKTEKNKVMTKSERYINLAIDYKDAYKKTRWWKFKQRRYLLRMYNHSVAQVIRIGDLRK